jgi:hypothetical protein
MGLQSDLRIVGIWCKSNYKKLRSVLSSSIIFTNLYLVILLYNAGWLSCTINTGELMISIVRLNENLAASFAATRLEAI